MLSRRDISHLLRLYLITDDVKRPAKELGRIVSEAIAGGVTAVQFREKNAAPGECAARLESVGRVCAESGIPLIINADIAGRTTSSFIGDGIHYGKKTIAEASKPRIAGRKDLILGYSAHSVEEIGPLINNALAQFVTLSPIFATPSKEGVLPPHGLSPLKQAREKYLEACIVALGGINAGNAASAVAAGASGIAVIRAIMAAPDPRRAARELREIVEAASAPN